MNRFIALSGLVIASPCMAADSATTSFAPALLQGLFGLALVLALIWGAAWLVKRLAPTALRSTSLLKIVSMTSVGQRERIVVVEINDTWLIVGVAPGRVNTLHTLPKGQSLPAEREGANFNNWLTKAREKLQAK